MMGFVSRRRRFILLVCVCCASFVAFGWYTKGDGLTYFVQLPHYARETIGGNELANSPQTPTRRHDSAHQNVPVIDDMNDLEYNDDDEAVTKTFDNLGYDLNSGPTDGVRSVTKRMESSSGAPAKELNDPLSVMPTLSTSPPAPKTETRSKKNAGLIIDTNGCKIPKLDPWDPTVLNLYEAHEKLECTGPPLFMNPKPNGIIALNESVLKEHYGVSRDELKCSYKAIKRKHEDPGNVRENNYEVEEPEAMVFDVPLNDEYVEVNCVFEEKNETFKQFFPLAKLKKDIEDARNVITSPEPRLNVILAGVDSVSKLNFLRHFNRTQAFLKNKLMPFEMKGYTKVGDNTFPNLVPLLTGHFVEYYWNESLRDSMYFDSIDLIWKDYAKRGYRTFYAEDSPFTGTFNYIKKGFYDPPTDYYFRPLALALEGSDIREYSSSHCYNSQLETDIIYDYLKDFIKTMDDRPFIAFAMVSTMTHDYLNNAAYADDPTVRLLEDLYESGALNNSVLVLFSDHGLRFGAIRETYIGKFEERMPFMYVHFPKWFLDKYPDIAKNLEVNQDRLITLFDIHATMIHLLDVNKEMGKTDVTLGASLLEEISTNRTCDEANILAHWCPCQTLEPVPVDGDHATKSAQAIMDDINSHLSSYKACAKLEVAKISDARLGLANELVMTFVRHENVVEDRKVIYGERAKPLEDYLITLTAKPGGAVFEGTVRHDTTQETYTVLGISRINMYGNSSWCIDSQKMKIYCYCN